MGNHGKHYEGPNGFQAFDVTRYMSGDMAQAWQYVYRVDKKGTLEDSIVDLEKAIAFISDWVAHPDVPVSRVPDHVVLSDGVNNAHMNAMFDVPHWSVDILTSIFTADTYSGKNLAGGPFNGRDVAVRSIIPMIETEIRRRRATLANLRG